MKKKPKSGEPARSDTLKPNAIKYLLPEFTSDEIILRNVVVRNNPLRMVSRFINNDT